MGTLGDNSDPLLALTIQHINQESSRHRINLPVFPMEEIIEDPQFIRDLSITRLESLTLPELD